METGDLRILLKNLCTSLQWSYAMFWKLQQLEHHPLLTYEEGFCDSEKPQQPCQSISSDLYLRQEDSFKYGTYISDVHSLEYPIGSAIADMSCCQYLLGEGVIGGVALTGTDFWLYSDDNESTEVISSLGYADGWLLPIAAGIMTTLLVPVLPYGVLQLGSYEKVVENLVTTADIRDRFFSTVAIATISPSFSYDDTTLLCSSIAMPEPENYKESCFSYSNDQHIMEYEDANLIYTAEYIDDDLQTANDQLVPLMDGNFADLQDISFLINDQENYYPYTDTNFESNTAVPNDIITADHIQEETEMWICELQEALIGLAFPREGELQHEAVKLAFQSEFELLEEALGSGIITNNDRNSYEDTVCSYEGFGSLDMDLYGPFVQEQLKEDVISTTYNTSDDTEPFHQCNTSKSSVNSLTEHATCNTKSAQEYVLADESTFTIALTSPPSLESLESAIIVEEQPLKSTNEKKSKSTIPSRLGNGKPKSKNRPRPRDRQLIQDRLKELRKLVPNGDKSSIDGLLDQTMKHMMFLKNVTERAEKAKHFIGQEVNAASINSQNSSGSNLALGSGNNCETCPILVRDLEHPCQFLIEMVCVDEGVFFEIAEVMHKLNLTILKGVMENRCKKWASFVVEAPKGFNRLDIFWPLMRILQQSGDWMMN